MKKRWLGFMACVLILVQLVPISSVQAADSEKAVDGNLFIQSTSNDFNSTDNCTDIAISGAIGDGAIVLKSGFNQGVYTSNVFSTSPFTKMVLSWDSDTPEGTSIQVEARVSSNSSEQWSDWLSWGTWGTSIKRASGNGVTDDSVAYVDVDTLVVKNGATANKIQYRVTLNSNTTGVTPSVRLVAGALRNTLLVQDITTKFTDDSNLPTLIKDENDVPQLSQMVRDPSIAHSICSPTSIAMILQYYGTNIIPEEAAWGVYDYDYADFGNWPFNTAYASSFGYQAYVVYSTLEGLKQEIADGHPVAVSVAYKNSDNVKANLPVINGAPIESTNGHLIVVCGFTKINGVDYVIINDSAAPNDAGVRVEYRLDQFAKAWAESGNIAYIIHEKEESAVYGAPVSLAADLAASSGKQNEYSLKYNGDIIDISNNNVKTIMTSTDGGKTYQYITPSNKSSLAIKKSKGQSVPTEYLFITGDGKTYSTTLK